MTKFVPIDAILNYIPETIKEEESHQQLKSWAFQSYSLLNFEFRWEYNYAIIPFENHKACLPTDALRIAYVGFSRFDYQDTINPYFTSNYPNGLDENDKRLIIYQQVWQDKSMIEMYRPLRYVGSSPDLLTNDCVNLVCKDCYINFSFDKMLKNVTIDEAEGYLLVIYGTNAKTEDGLIIPNDSNLLQGLAYYAQAQHWLNRASRHEANGFNMVSQLLELSKNLITRFKASHMLKKINSNHVKDNTFRLFEFQKSLKR